MKISSRSLLLCPMLLVASMAFGQHRTFNVNPDASTVNFTLGDVMHSVNGTFHVQSGSVDFDTADPKISGSVVVAAGSGKSGNDTRDHKMAKDILEAAKFAEVSFVPTSYQGNISTSGDSTIQVAGTFTIHGTPHDLTVPMQIHMDGANCTVKTHFVLPYVKWGLKDPSNFVLRVAKEVGIDLVLVGRLSSSS